MNRNTKISVSSVSLSEGTKDVQLTLDHYKGEHLLVTPDGRNTLLVDVIERIEQILIDERRAVSVHCNSSGWPEVDDRTVRQILEVCSRVVNGPVGREAQIDLIFELS